MFRIFSFTTCFLVEFISNGKQINAPLSKLILLASFGNILYPSPPPPPPNRTLVHCSVLPIISLHQRDVPEIPQNLTSLYASPRGIFRALGNKIPCFLRGRSLLESGVRTIQTESPTTWLEKILSYFYFKSSAPFFSQFSKCLRKSPLVGKVTSQKRHCAIGFSLFLLSPQTLRMCFLRWDSRPNRLPHTSHLNGRRWSWRVLMCMVTVESWRKAMPHLKLRRN